MARSGWKWMAAAGVLVSVVLAGTALAASNDGAPSGGGTGVRAGWHGPGVRHGLAGKFWYGPRDWDRWQEALEKDPAKAAQALERAVQRIDRESERLAGIVADAEKELASETDPAKKQFLEARLNVWKAQQTVLSRQKELLQVLLNQARTRSGSSSGTST